MPAPYFLAFSVAEKQVRQGRWTCASLAEIVSHLFRASLWVEAINSLACVSGIVLHKGAIWYIPWVASFYK